MGNGPCERKGAVVGVVEVQGTLGGGVNAAALAVVIAPQDWATASETGAMLGGECANCVAGNVRYPLC